MRAIRVAATAAVLLSSACARSTWMGRDAITRAVPASPNATLVAAARALQAHGYKARIVSGQLVVTLPQPVPQYTREVSTNPETNPQEWVIQVAASDNSLESGTALTVSGYLVPPATAGDSVPRTTTLVTEDQPQLFREVRRVGDWIVDALRNPPAVPDSGTVAPRQP